jgi:hypothetical protein
MVNTLLWVDLKLDDMLAIGHLLAHDLRTDAFKGSRYDIVVTGRKDILFAAQLLRTMCLELSMDSQTNVWDSIRLFHTHLTDKQKHWELEQRLQCQDLFGTKATARLISELDVPPASDRNLSTRRWDRVFLMAPIHPLSASEWFWAALDTNPSCRVMASMGFNSEKNLLPKERAALLKRISGIVGPERLLLVDNRRSYAKEKIGGKMCPNDGSLDRALGARFPSLLNALKAMGQSDSRQFVLDKMAEVWFDPLPENRPLSIQLANKFFNHMQGPEEVISEELKSAEEFSRCIESLWEEGTLRWDPDGIASCRRTVEDWVGMKRLTASNAVDLHKILDAVQYKLPPYVNKSSHDLELEISDWQQLALALRPNWSEAYLPTCLDPFDAQMTLADDGQSPLALGVWEQDLDDWNNVILEQIAQPLAQPVEKKEEGSAKKKKGKRALESEPASLEQKSEEEEESFLTISETLLQLSKSASKRPKSSHTRSDHMMAD